MINEKHKCVKMSALGHFPPFSILAIQRQLPGVNPTSSERQLSAIADLDSKCLLSAIRHIDVTELA